MITAVEVSRETGKNLPAVKQQTLCDLMMTITRFFRRTRPTSSIGKLAQGPENIAFPTFTLSCIKSSQLYVNIKSWQRVPAKFNAKLTFLEAGVSICSNKIYYPNRRTIFRKYLYEKDRANRMFGCCIPTRNN